jgi:hypothetical protein
MNPLLHAENLPGLIAEINHIPLSEPVHLLEKIKTISDALAGKDFKIARHLHELQVTLFTGKESNADNFADIRNKLLYLLEQIGKL